MLEWLYLQGVPVNRLDCYGFSPLHWAVHENRVLVVQHLLRCSVSIDCRDTKKRTPLHWLAKKGRSRVFETMLCLDAFGSPSAHKTLDCAARRSTVIAASRLNFCLAVQLVTTCWWR